jgi:hypothetical protein
MLMPNGNVAVGGRRSLHVPRDKKNLHTPRFAGGEDAKLTVSNQANQGLFAVREGHSVYVLSQRAAGYNLNSEAE